MKPHNTLFTIQYLVNRDNRIRKDMKGYHDSTINDKFLNLSSEDDFKNNIEVYATKFPDDFKDWMFCNKKWKSIAKIINERPITVKEIRQLNKKIEDECNDSLKGIADKSDDPILKELLRSLR